MLTSRGVYFFPKKRISGNRLTRTLVVTRQTVYLSKTTSANKAFQVCCMFKDNSEGVVLKEWMLIGG